MGIVYRIYHPKEGTHVDAQTLDECLEKVVNMAWDIYIDFTHNSPYFVVETSEDGLSEVWRNPQGEEVISPEEIKRRALLKQTAPTTTMPITPVETLP